MAKKVLVISTSMRNNANYDILADEFIKGAIASGNDAQKITLKDKKIAFCKGCLSCAHTKKCVIDDDVTEIFEKIKEVDVVVWATPVYYYAMSGQMKTLMDRMNALYSLDYKFREIYLIATAADVPKSAIKGTLDALKCWMSCFGGVKLMGAIEGTGLTSPNEVKAHNNYLLEAYNMGKSV